MSEDVIRTGRDLAYQGTVLKVYKDHMKFSNGNTEEWDFIHHDGAAAVIPVMEDGKILMVKQYRNALERDTLEIPAGKLDDPNEEGIVCAARELKEETGLSEFKYVEKFDEYQFYDVKSKKYLRRHVFHFESAKDLLDQWSYRVKGDGLDKNLNFHYF